MPGELLRQTVTIIHHQPSPEDDGLAQMWLDRSSAGYMLLEGDHTVPRNFMRGR